MYGWSKLNKNESGQAALEAAIILIAFVVVASVFAFAILSAGTASTEKGEAAIYAGLEGVQSSMQTKGAIIANTAAGAVTNVVFTVALVAGGEPVNMDPAATTNATIISYRDSSMAVNSVVFTVDDIVGDGDDLLEDGELFEITATIPAAVGNEALIALAASATNQAFSLEVKPPTGGVLQINRTTPASLDTVTELR
jgi:flagellin FlaB